MFKNKPFENKCKYISRYKCITFYRTDQQLCSFTILTV